MQASWDNSTSVSLNTACFVDILCINYLFGITYDNLFLILSEHPMLKAIHKTEYQDHLRVIYCYVLNIISKPNIWSQNTNFKLCSTTYHWFAVNKRLSVDEETTRNIAIQYYLWMYKHQGMSQLLLHWRVKKPYEMLYYGILEHNVLL